tara:strand:+ start:12046 stop:13041 length:996 start_codon:yes stop_codon:yes gene_type:complete
MDPITHGLIGAAATQSFSNKKNLRQVSLVGFFSALLPDLDVFISRASDPLLNLEFHRQFTHSLVFIPVGALIASALIWWLVKKQLSFKETYFYSLLAYGSACLSDAATSYGVQLLWPFLDERFSWNLISIFDPLFSLIIIVAVGFSLYKKKSLFAWVGLGWIAVYLSFGFLQQQRVRNVAQEIASQKGHVIEQLIIKPTMANEILWSVRYTYGDSLFTHGVRLIPFSKPTLYVGESAALLSWKKKYAPLKGSILYQDIERFSTFSDGILITHPDYENVIGDGRYSLLPTSLSPIWGIEIDTTKSNQHVPFGTYRKPTKEVRQRFMDMLLGK